ncbi:MAG TPA: polysaccharide ABC transporter ATP-binding protein [Actinomycetota bacterium]|jgi:ABC-2 type transport system ATP-binding protein/lipopolysaccharide transport system ATP-binding protein
MDAVVARDIVKTYRVKVGRARVREMLPPPIDRGVRRVFPKWWTKDTFNALDGVELAAPAGSSVGIVGHNGAGKTTLLKVIAGVTFPTRGSVEVQGRIAALIDALVGFHPDLTGRENCYLLGAMHGYSRKGMKGRIERIVDFSGIGDELADTPLKRYSAGMAARLGFSIITALDVEILLVDEILAVGDAAFQRKCVGWLEQYRRDGGTLLFVSHNLGLVRNMTERAIWIDHGKLLATGSTGDVLAQYAQAMERRETELAIGGRKQARKEMESRGMNRWGAGGAQVETVHFDQRNGAGSALDVEIAFDAPALDEAVFCVGFIDEGGRELGSATSPTVRVPGPRGEVRCSISPLPLRSGIYFPVVAILSADGVVRDRWKLERAVVVDRVGDGEVLADAFGPLEIAATWSDGEPAG